MEIIKAPSQEKPSFRTVFLAGGISNCPDWQDEVARQLEAEALTILNPRRDAFPYELHTEEEQIRWEYEHLRSADLVIFWFPGESLDPITLFELGAALERRQSLVVGIDPTYQRRANIEIQMKLCHPEITPVYSLDDLVVAIK